MSVRRAPLFAVCLALIACNNPAVTPESTVAGEKRRFDPADAATPRPTAIETKATPKPNGPTPTVRKTNTPDQVGATPAPSPTPAPELGPIVLGLPQDADGSDPKSVYFSEIGDVEVMDDGTVYMTGRRQLWRFQPGGTLKLAAGGHLTRSSTIEGKRGPDAGFGNAPYLAVLNGGTSEPLLAYERGLARLKFDGTLHSLWEGDSNEQIAGVVPQGNGMLALLVRTGTMKAGATGTFAWWSVRDGAAPIRSRSATAAEADALSGASSQAFKKLGLPGLLGTAQNNKLVVLDGDTAKALSPEGGTPAAVNYQGAKANALDAAGRGIQFTASTGALAVLSAAKGPQTVVARLPEGFTPAAIAPGPDGALYVAGSPANAPGQRLYRLKDDSTELLAGAVNPPLNAPLQTAVLPVGLDRTGDGGVYVADALRDQILKVVAGKQPEVVAGKADGTTLSEGEDATAVKLKPGAISIDRQKRLCFVNDRNSVWRIDDDAKVRRLYTAPAGYELRELAASTEDVVVAAHPTTTDAKPRLLRLSGTGTATDLPVGADAVDIFGLAVSGEQAVDFAVATRPGLESDGTRLLRSVINQPFSATTPSVTSPRAWLYAEAAFGLLEVGPKGDRLFATGIAGSDLARVTRFSAADGTTGTFLGAGGAAFTGDTTDTGISAPRAMVRGDNQDYFVIDGLLVKRVLGFPE